MKQNIPTIDYEWLTKPTGDPFADTGGFVIQYLMEKRFPEKDIDELIEYVISIYSNNWKKSIYSFFPNSPIINASSKIPEKEAIEKYLEIINDKKALNDYCRITGRKTNVFMAGKDKFILAGSGSFANFHHTFEKGLLLSKEILIRLLFVPIGVIKLGKYYGLINTNNTEVTKYLIETNISKNLQNIATGVSEGIFESEFSITENALFDYADTAINNINFVKAGKTNIALTLYHFTNYNQGPDLDLYVFPATLFEFYRYCNVKYRKDWQRFVRAHYHNTKKQEAKYNPAEEKMEVVKKTKTESFEIDEYKTWTNWIYSKLLNGSSILPEFLRWSKNGNKINLDIVNIYEINIRNMKKETIKKIMEIADFIIHDRSEDEIKKLITKLNGANQAFELRRFLLTLVEENYNNGNEKPIMSVNDYANYLFADGSNYREVRDVLLIAIYQKLHEFNIKVETPIEEEK
jgi:CRISPR-associated protein Cst1